MPSPRMRSSRRFNSARLGRVHAGGGLVEREQLRLGRQRARDLETPLVAVGEARRRARAARPAMPT